VHSHSNFTKGLDLILRYCLFCAEATAQHKQSKAIVEVKYFMSFNYTVLLGSLTPELTGREASAVAPSLAMKGKLIPLRSNELLDRPLIVSLNAAFPFLICLTPCLAQ